MIVFLNGKFVTEDKAVVSVFDRGFLYGDGLFEALLIKAGKPFGWDQHMERLAGGIEFLKLTLPFALEQLHLFALELIRRNGTPDCILRITLSRGITARGYSPKGAVNPAIVMTIHPLPVLDTKKVARWRVITSTHRLSVNDPLTRFKTANKLPQVLARAEADAAGAQEAILLNTAGYIAEGTTSNVFWLERDVVCTTPLPAGALPGVTRRAILDLCARRNLECREKNAKPDTLHKSLGAFLTMTSMGVVEIESLDGRRLRRSPLVNKLSIAYLAMLSEPGANHTIP
ncbi:MAG TPA: aminotransferase class IV [Verrucomicrobiae bacterium]